EGGNNIMLVAQKAASKDEPSAEDLYEIGCAASILQMLKLPDGTVKVLVEGVQRARITELTATKDLFKANVVSAEPEQSDGPEHEALRRAVLAQFEQYVKLNKKIPQEILSS